MTLLWILLAYLLGSFPTGLVVVRLVRGVDVRTVGSGNIGAANVSRAAGKGWATLVAVTDMLKGGVGVILARLSGITDPWILSGVGFAGVCGHNFPCWLRFRGGKGVATSFGVLACLEIATFPGGSLSWLAPLLGGGVWFGTVRLTGYAAVASLLALAVQPPLLLLLGAPGPHGAFAVALFLLAVWRHRENLRRLRAGSENRVGGRR
jgi:glycerol-3-phosphate acyltransferase PlsY